MAKKTTTQKHKTVLYRMVKDILTLQRLIGDHSRRIADLEHHGSSGSADRKLDHILAQLEKLMTKADDMLAKLDEIDTQTNEIAADIDNLLAQPLEGLTKDQADAIQARLSAHADTLRGIAAKA